MNTNSHNIARHIQVVGKKKKMKDTTGKRIQIYYINKEDKLNNMSYFTPPLEEFGEMRGMSISRTTTAKSWEVKCE